MSEIKSKKNRSGVHIVLGLFVLGCLVALLLNHYWKNIQDKLNLFEAGAMEITIDEPSISDITRIITPYQSIETKDRYAKISSRELKSYYIVLAANQEKVKLLDYAIKGVNENPKLSYESTARSLVYMNPFLSNVPTALKNKIYSQVSKHPKFGSLVKLISHGNDILSEEIFFLSTDMALDYLSTNSSVIGNLSSSKIDQIKQQINLSRFTENQNNSQVFHAQDNPAPKPNLVSYQVTEPFGSQRNKQLNSTDVSKVNFFIFSNFNYDDEHSLNLLWGGARLKLNIDDNGKVKITGTPRVAERAVLLKGGLTNTSIGNKECKKSVRKICDTNNIIVQPIILPEERTETGLDLIAIEELSSGLYTVLLSGFDPYVDENSLSASHYNIMQYLKYILKIITGDIIDAVVEEKIYNSALKVVESVSINCIDGYNKCIDVEELSTIAIELVTELAKDEFSKASQSFLNDYLVSRMRQIGKIISILDIGSKIVNVKNSLGIVDYFAYFVARGNNPYYARFGIQKFSALLAPIINEISSSSPANLPVLLPEKFPTFSGVQLYPKVFSTESSLGVSIYISPTNQGTATLIGSLYMEKTTLNQLNVPYARYLARSTENIIAPDVTAIHGHNCLVPKTVYVRPDLEGYYTIDLCGGSISGIHRIEWLDKQVIYSISWRGFGNIAPYIDNQPFNKDTLDQQYSQEFISIASSMASNLPLEKK